eukprot:scaffold201740_cov31-Tisochrysis_lutea.AAC.2
MATTSRADGSKDMMRALVTPPCTSASRPDMPSSFSVDEPGPAPATRALCPREVPIAKVRARSEGCDGFL